MFELNSRYVANFNTAPGTMFHQYKGELESFAAILQHLISVILSNDVDLGETLRILSLEEDFSRWKMPIDLYKSWISTYLEDIIRIFVAVKGKRMPKACLIETTKDSAELMVQLFALPHHTENNIEGKYTLTHQKIKGLYQPIHVEVLNTADLESESSYSMDFIRALNHHIDYCYNNKFIYLITNHDMDRLQYNENYDFRKVLELDYKVNKKLRIGKGIFPHYWFSEVSDIYDFSKMISDARKGIGIMSKYIDKGGN